LQARSALLVLAHLPVVAFLLFQQHLVPFGGTAHREDHDSSHEDGGKKCSRTAESC
jgi:hypothetical protein